VLKNFGAPLATKFTYKKRSGGKRDVGSRTRPGQTNIFKKKEEIKFLLYNGYNDIINQIKQNNPELANIFI